jgi:predicted ATPase
MQTEPADIRSNLHVVTGGPGAGKTTLLESLARDGLAVAPEAGRAIIRAQKAIGGRALPDRDPALYAELMLAWDIRSYDAACNSRHTVFDRGIPDTIGYLRLVGLPVPPHMLRAAETHRYDETVFILPPWPEIYAGDTERSQSLAEAERTYEAMKEIYGELGYRLVHIPRAPVAERRDLLLAHICET